MHYDPATGKMDFCEALKALRRGREVRRERWPDGIFLRVSEDFKDIQMFSNKKSWSWHIVPADLLAKDWIELV